MCLSLILLSLIISFFFNFLLYEYRFPSAQFLSVFSFLVHFLTISLFSFDTLFSLFLFLFFLFMRHPRFLSFSSQILMMGSPGSGKSTLINALMGNPLVLSSQPASVRGVKIHRLPGSAIHPELQFWDFPSERGCKSCQID